MRRFSLAVLLLSVSTAKAEPIKVAVPPRNQPVSYSREIADILEGKCTGCHSSALAENKLNIEDVAGMLKGGKRGPAIVPGKADESLLFKLAAHRAEPFMPPKDKKDQSPLTPEELGVLKLWIDSGAKDDSEGKKEPAKPIELGVLPPGVHPINAVDMTADGTRVAVGRANVVHVYDVESGVELIALGGHKDLIQSVRFSPNGRRLAAGSYQWVTLWDLPGGGLAKTFNGHNDQVNAVAVSADGKTAYSGSADATIRVWSVADGKQVRQWNHPGPVLSLALAGVETGGAPAEPRLYSGGQDGVVHVWNPNDGKEIATHKGHTGPVLALLASLADRWDVVSASADGTVREWPIAAGKPGEKLAEPVVKAGHKGPVYSLALVEGAGPASLLTGGEDGTIRSWSGKESKTMIENGTPVHAFARDKRGRIWTAAPDGKVRVFESGKLVNTLAAHTGAVSSIVYHAESDQMATSGADGGLKIWDASRIQGVIAFGHTAPNNGPIQPLNRVAFAGRGMLLSASADKTLKSWRFEGEWSERKPLGPHVFRVLAIDFNPDGSLLATGGGEPSRSGEVKVWEVNKGMLVRTLDSLHSDTVFGVRYSPDGTRLATCAADKFLKVIDGAGKELKAFEGHTHHVLGVDWRSDGKQLVTAGADNVLKVWDFDNGEQLRTLQAAGKQVTSVRWLPNKSEAVGASGDRLVRLWNTDNGGIARTFGGPNDFVFAAASSNDGNRIAAGGADGVLFIWNGQNAQVLKKLEPLASAAAKP
jgi:WD40 repeat protein